jgi:hypothetical protein
VFSHGIIQVQARVLNERSGIAGFDNRFADHLEVLGALDLDGFRGEIDVNLGILVGRQDGSGDGARTVSASHIFYAIVVHGRSLFQ